MPTNDPNNQPPQIPSFKKDDKEKKGGAIPILGQGGKPALTIRGMGHGTTLMERLKQFKKKDMAFIASGLAVLLMAPLAEHFLLGPKDDPNTLKRGFDSKGNVFTDVSPYEPGTGGMSPGGLAGSNQDIITPLNVRDPSALIMGPGAQQTPSTTVSAPTTTKSDSGGWKDALVEAAKSNREGGLPGPRGNMAGALRGLSALAGSSYGGGPSYGLPPISAGNVPNRGADSSALSRVQGAPGYKGVAERGPGAGSNTLDALKKAGADQAGLFNRSGSAGANLDAAAASAIPGGGAGSDLGGPGGGEANKSPGGNQGKDSKSLGESLAFLRAKMNMEKELELYWKKREFKEFELQKTLITELLKLGITNLAGKALIEPGSQYFGQLLFCSGNRNQNLTLCQQASAFNGFIGCDDGNFRSNGMGLVWGCARDNTEMCPQSTTGPAAGTQAMTAGACISCKGCKRYGLGTDPSKENEAYRKRSGALSMNNVEGTAQAIIDQFGNCSSHQGLGKEVCLAGVESSQHAKTFGSHKEQALVIIGRGVDGQPAGTIEMTDFPVVVREYRGFVTNTAQLVGSLYNQVAGHDNVPDLLSKLAANPQDTGVRERLNNTIESTDRSIRYSDLSRGDGMFGHPIRKTLASARTAIDVVRENVKTAQEEVNGMQTAIRKMEAELVKGDNAAAGLRSIPAMKTSLDNASPSLEAGHRNHEAAKEDLGKMVTALNFQQVRLSNMEQIDQRPGVSASKTPPDPALLPKEPVEPLIAMITKEVAKVKSYATAETIPTSENIEAFRISGETINAALTDLNAKMNQAFVGPKMVPAASSTTSPQASAQ